MVHPAAELPPGYQAAQYFWTLPFASEMTHGRSPPALSVPEFVPCVTITSLRLTKLKPSCSQGKHFAFCCYM
uniref:Uncharacterized protein n=1 Tax=Anguilla anguilla TaxID=7936 RepID=A0A0E9WAR6_ANGAN